MGPPRHPTNRLSIRAGSRGHSQGLPLQCQASTWLTRAQQMLGSCPCSWLQRKAQASHVRGTQFLTSIDFQRWHRPAVSLRLIGYSEGIHHDRAASSGGRSGCRITPRHAIEANGLSSGRRDKCPAEKSLTSCNQRRVPRGRTPGPACHQLSADLGHCCRGREQMCTWRQRFSCLGL